MAVGVMAAAVVEAMPVPPPPLSAAEDATGCSPTPVAVVVPVVPVVACRIDITIGDPSRPAMAGGENTPAEPVATAAGTLDAAGTRMWDRSASDASPASATAAAAGGSMAAVAVSDVSTMSLTPDVSGGNSSRWDSFCTVTAAGGPSISTSDASAATGAAAMATTADESALGLAAGSESASFVAVGADMAGAAVAAPSSSPKWTGPVTPASVEVGVRPMPDNREPRPAAVVEYGTSSPSSPICNN
jgi:hypothetical protein